MSTSILYHAFGFRGIEYKATRYDGEYIIFEAEMVIRNIPCPECDNEKVIFKGNKWREFLLPSVGRKRSLMRLLLHRVQCTECHHLWWPRLSFMVGKHSYVRSFALQVIDLLKFGTIQDVTRFLGTGWDMVKNIHKMKSNPCINPSRSRM